MPPGCPPRPGRRFPPSPWQGIVTGGGGSHHVVDEVGEGPDDRDAYKGDAEQHDMEQSDGQHVGQPDTTTVHHPRVRVHLAVCCAHIHPAAPLLLLCRQAVQVRRVLPCGVVGPLNTAGSCRWACELGVGHFCCKAGLTQGSPVPSLSQRMSHWEGSQPHSLQHSFEGHKVWPGDS